jgi:flagellar hook-associated protein 3 FlgL
MVASRVSTLAQQQLVTSNALRTQRNLNDLQVQIASGKKTQSFSGIAEDAGRLVNLKSELSQAEQFIQNITITEKRLDLMAFAMDELEDIARKARTDFAGAFNGGAADKMQLSLLAQASLDQVVEVLNTRDDSRFLFSGGAVQTKPANLSNAAYTAPAPGSPPTFVQTVETGYYQGDAVAQSTRADDGFNVSYGINADESAFEKLIRTLDNVSNITFTDPITAQEKTFLTAALAELTELIDNNGNDKTLSDLRADVGLDRVVLDSIRDKHNDFLNFAQDSIAEIENINPAEVISALNFEQLQLEASFTTIARIQSLSLSNFLR